MLVPRARYTEALNLMESAVAKYTVGDPWDPGTRIGPSASKGQYETVLGFIERAQRDGARLLTGGADMIRDTGYYVAPTVFVDVDPDSELGQEEVFGPVLSVVRAESLADAIALINASPFANGTAIFTRSGYAARRFQNEVEVGMIGVNVPIPVPMAFFSFGGWKASLFGDLNVHGMDGVRFYTRGKTVTSRWPDDGSAAPGFHMPMMG